MNTPRHQKSAEFNLRLSKEERLNRLFSETKKNTHLPYFNPQEQFVAGFGNKESKIVFIGEAPGKEESIQGKPFVGKSGKLLSELLLQHGIKREELYITNVVKYRPPNNKTPDYAESMIWASACLHEELAIIQPQIIVTLGACATKVFFGKKIQMSLLQGTIQQFNNFCIVPAFHPAFLLRNRTKIGQMQKTLTLIQKL